MALGETGDRSVIRVPLSPLKSAVVLLCLLHLRPLIGVVC
jgi:hypothetical protein